jgi:hypothetical protein
MNVDGARLANGVGIWHLVGAGKALVQVDHVLDPEFKPKFLFANRCDQDGDWPKGSTLATIRAKVGQVFTLMLPESQLVISLSAVPLLTGQLHGGGTTLDAPLTGQLHGGGITCDAPLTDQLRGSVITFDAPLTGQLYTAAVSLSTPNAKRPPADDEESDYAKLPPARRQHKSSSSSTSSSSDDDDDDDERDYTKPPLNAKPRMLFYFR